MSIEEQVRGLEKFRDEIRALIDFFPNLVRFKSAIQATLPTHTHTNTDISSGSATVGYVLKATLGGGSDWDAEQDLVTLDANADTLLGLTGQQLTLDTQTANRVLAGPTTGAAAVPTFRALVQADLPATWQTWSPTFTGYSANPTGGVYRYCIVGKICHFVIREPNTGTSNLGSLTISAPVQAATITGAMWLTPAALVNNGSALTSWGRGRIGSGESVFTFGTNPAIDGGFTSTGNKRVAAFEGFYEI